MLKAVAFLLWGFGVMFWLALLGASDTLSALGFLIGGLLGVLIETSRDRQDRALHAMREAAKQERQARLTADTVAERSTRQELGEFH